MPHKTGLEDYYSIRNNRKMRFGYTTGTCAAAASEAAARMLLSGEEIRDISFMTPKGILLNLEILHIEKGEDLCPALCARTREMTGYNKHLKIFPGKENR